MISAPVILYPKTNWVSGTDEQYYSDALVQMISGYIPVTAADLQNNVIFTVQYRYRIDRNGQTGTYSSFSETGITVGQTNLNVVEIPWSLNTEDIIDMEVGDAVHFEFKAVKRSNVYTEVGIILDQSSVIKLRVDIVLEQQIEATVDPATGVRIKQARDYIKILIPRSSILLNQDSEFAGCNFYIALVAGGGTNGYVRMNDVLVTETDASETEVTVLEESSFEDSANDLTIETTKSRQVNNEFFTYSFTKDVLSRLILEGKLPNIFLSDGQSLNEDQSYYFVTTVNAFDEVLNQSVESPYSREIEGKFVFFTDDYRNLPSRTRNDVLFSMSKDLMSNNDLINVVGGSVIRDMLDPISLEFEKFYVIQDFIFSTYSLDTLLAFDDADGDGVSDPISTSLQKRRLADALGLADGATLQLLIDEQFDKIAANYNITRMDSTKATGTVTLYVNQRPTEDILIPDGTVVSFPGDVEQNLSPVEFVIKGTKIMDVANAEYYYNAASRRYELESDIEARQAGSSGNIPAGTITVITNVNPLVQIENSVPTQYGSDRESNQQISVRIKLARISYDSGTEGGYTFVAYGVPLVLEVRVEKASDPLMMRDYDRREHRNIGGKVDVYIRGERISETIDQVAFKYEYPTDTYGNKVGEVFDVVSAREYRIRTTNPKVTENSPIVFVNSVRNVTKAKNYDISGIQIVGKGDTLILSNNIDNNAIGMTAFDVIEVDYKYRSSNEVILENQPVHDISQVTDSQGTIIDPSKYVLVKMEDPLINGRSSISTDRLKFLFNEGDNINEFIEVTDEEHDMLLNTPARLAYKGVDIETIVVSNISDDTDIYIKDVDYSVTAGSDTDYTYLNLLQNGKIRHGDRVNVAYTAGQNFSISYTVNSLTEDVQDKISEMKHACADTIVKEAVKNNIDISFKVVRKTGVDKTLLKSRIQTSIANYVRRLRMGETFTQGALIRTVLNTTGVADIVMPLTRLMKRNSSFIPLDDLGELEFEVYQRTTANGVISYRSLDSVLTYRTSENGGDQYLFRAVYENDIALWMVRRPGDVSRARGQAYIQSDGKIIVSTLDGLPPQKKYYKASYYTYYPEDVNVVQDIETATIEYIDVDSQSLKDIEILDEKIVKRGL